MQRAQNEFSQACGKNRKKQNARLITIINTHQHLFDFTYYEILKCCDDDKNDMATVARAYNAILRYTRKTFDMIDEIKDL